MIRLRNVSMAAGPGSKGEKSRVLMHQDVNIHLALCFHDDSPLFKSVHL